MKPRIGDHCWVEGKKQPNGEIYNIDWYDKEVYVQCYDTDEHVCIPFEKFQYFNESLNQWIIHEDYPGEFT